MPCDVIVAGAGPAGTLAATILARAGLRVELFDRARFPRPKLCGDTLNPGALRVLGRSLSTRAIEQRGLALHGMMLTGAGVSVRAAYGNGRCGRAITRRELDQMLLDEAIAAGVEFFDRTTVSEPVIDHAGTVTGVVINHKGGRRSQRTTRYVVAADGRESRLARAVRLTRHALRPRRWAIGGYFKNVDVNPLFGEMHVRRGHYIGVAPVPGGLANACLVLPHTRGSGPWANPAQMLRDAICRDPVIAERFARGELVEGPHVLGPMAVDATGAGVPGMLLAGDAAGFIDPITGDGLRFALEGSALAAHVILDVVAGRCPPGEAPATLAKRRRAAFATKWRFNRIVRGMVSAPGAVKGAALVGRIAPQTLAAVIRYAGDV